MRIEAVNHDLSREKTYFDSLPDFIRWLNEWDSSFTSLPSFTYRIVECEHNKLQTTNRDGKLAYYCEECDETTSQEEVCPECKEPLVSWDLNPLGTHNCEEEMAVKKESVWQYYRIKTKAVHAMNKKTQRGITDLICEVLECDLIAGDAEWVGDDFIRMENLSPASWMRRD